MTSDPEDRKIVTVEQLTHYIFNEGPIVPFDDLEPAPPKDWRPRCFTFDSSRPGYCLYGCDGEIMNKCPYRQLE